MAKGYILQVPLWAVEGSAIAERWELVIQENQSEFKIEQR